MMQQSVSPITILIYEKSGAHSSQPDNSLKQTNKTHEYCSDLTCRI